MRSKKELHGMNNYCRWQIPLLSAVQRLGRVVSPTPFGLDSPPLRGRMTVVSWLGIYPTVAIFIGPVQSFLESLPFLVSIALITAMVAVTMF